MKYINKIYNQECYHGNNKKKYFEGWYYKNVTNDGKVIISFIVGVSKSDDSHCFIQVIESINNKSCYVRYDINDFEYGINPFYIKIKDNFFSLDRVIINISDVVDVKANLIIFGITKIDKNAYAPNIMGPFAYIPFMECNHGVVSLKHDIVGFVKINGEKVFFNNGVGYIEKDYGTSFPTKYMWLQSNDLVNGNNIFLSIATIPFLCFKFNGLISILQIEGKQYRFSTYNLGCVKKIVCDDYYLIEIKQFNYFLKIKIFSGTEIELISPSNGVMKEKVYESLSSRASVSLYKRNKKVFCDDFMVCASEFML